MVKPKTPRPNSTGSEPAAVGWHIEAEPVDYGGAVAAMERRARAIRNGSAPELVWLVEHPPLYTAGTSAREEDLIAPARFDVHRTGRGGQYTYHGPGQRVAYVMVDVGHRFGGDVRAFVSALEDWLIAALAEFNVRGERREGRVGIWVARPERAPGSEDKVAAIGIRLRRWVSFHGISLNVEPDLEHYSGIVPCGISEHGVTSLADLGLPVTMTDADIALKRAFVATFGAEPERAPSPLLATDLLEDAE